MVATGGMDGKVRVWRRVKGKQTEDQTTVEAWRSWEFLTSLDTSDEITVSKNVARVSAVQQACSSGIVAHLAVAGLAS